MTSTDHGHDGRVLAQGHPMGLRPCRFRAGYYKGGKGVERTYVGGCLGSLYQPRLTAVPE